MSRTSTIVGSPKRGFTLIELLVVVAIIALLIAILLPSLGRARERAKIAACMSNLHQMAVMYKLYVGDYNSKGLLYDADTSAITATHPYSVTQYMGDLRPYGLNKKVMLCPDATTPTSRANEIGGAQLAWDAGNVPGVTQRADLIESIQGAVTTYYRGSYCFNGWLFIYIAGGAENQYCGTGANVIYQPIANLPEGKVPMFGDGDFFVTWPRYADWTTAPGKTVYDPDGDIASGNTNKGSDTLETPYMTRFAVDRHAEHTDNISFADGHAENMKLAKLWTLQWNSSQNTFNTAAPGANIPTWSMLPK